MSDRTPAAVSGYQDEAAGDGYFAPLASAAYMQLITPNPDGSQATAVVRGVVIGDRAYVRAWSHSDAAKNLRHTRRVQVAPCAVRGFLRLAPPLDAVARLLSGEEASQVAGKLARESEARRHFPVPLLHRVHQVHPARHRQVVHYELSASEPAAATAHDRAALDVPDRPAADPPGGAAGARQVTVAWSPDPYPWPP